MTGKTSHTQESKRLILLRWHYSELPYRSNEIPIKISTSVFAEIGEILTFIWKYKGLRIAKTILKKKNKAGGIMLTNFKI